MNTKQANWGNFGHDVSGALRTGLAGAIATTAITGAGMAAGKMWDAITKKHDYNSMLKANPDLMDHHNLRPTDMANAFTSLRTMNPAFSKDPLVAGSYMRRAMDAGANAGGVMREALEARDKMPSYMMESVLRGGAEGAKAHLDAQAKQRAGQPFAQREFDQRQQQFDARQQQDQQQFQATALQRERDARFNAHSEIERNPNLRDAAKKLGLIQ